MTQSKNPTYNQFIFLKNLSMKFKSLLASVAIAMLIAPTAFASFEPTAPADFFSNKTSVTLDAALNGSLKQNSCR